MIIEVLKSKIHRAKVTQAELNYVGSITIDEDLLDAANMIANEKVQIVNNNNGARFETYVIRGERGSGTICLNGAAARLAQVGDIVIIMSYAYMEMDEARKSELIFLPGLSSRDQSTEISGMGVGMDAVAAWAKAAGGRVEVSSRLEVGTTIVLRLPGDFGDRAD